MSPLQLLHVNLYTWDILYRRIRHRYNCNKIFISYRNIQSKQSTIIKQFELSISTPGTRLQHATGVIIISVQTRNCKLQFLLDVQRVKLLHAKSLLVQKKTKNSNQPPHQICIICVVRIQYNTHTHTVHYSENTHLSFNEVIF